MLDLSELPLIVKNSLELKEETELTFSNALEIDMSPELFRILDERRVKGVEKNFISTTWGQQGSGKCVYEHTNIYYLRKGRGWIVGEIKDLKEGDIIYGIGKSGYPQKVKVKNVWKRQLGGYTIKTKRSSDLICSSNHKHFVKKDGIFKEVQTTELKVGDSLLNFRWFNTNPIDYNSKDYSTGFLTGAYLADGNISQIGHTKFIIISKSKGEVFDLITYHFKKVFGIELKTYKSQGRNALMMRSCDIVAVKYFESFGSGINKSFIPFSYNRSFLKGLLDGYINCDSSINCKDRAEFGVMTNSINLTYALQTTIAMFGFCPSFGIRILKSGQYMGNEYFRLKFGRSEGQRFYSFINLVGKKFEILTKIKLIPELHTNADEIKVFHNLFENEIKEIIPTESVNMVDIETSNGTFFLANNILTHNSYSNLFFGGYLDEDFNSEKMFFDVNEVVYNRKNLKRHTAVLVDEQTRQFGIDMMRIGSIINALKEQLRKRAIHFLYASPVLRDERNSNYVFETMYTEEKTKTNILAMKTNELLTLGYVRIPHPLNVISKKLLLDYEKLKDEHLDKLTNSPLDSVQETADKVIADQFFKDMEKMYLQKKQYIPSKILVQIINKIFPEFNSSIIVHEIADRIRMTKEFSKEWQPR